MLETGITMSDIAKKLEQTYGRKVTIPSIRNCIIGKTNPAWIRATIEKMLGKNPEDVWVHLPELIKPENITSRQPTETEKRVRYLMDNRGISMAELARQCQSRYGRHISRSGIWNVITGKSNSFMIQQLIREVLTVDKPQDGWI